MGCRKSIHFISAAVVVFFLAAVLVGCQAGALGYQGKVVKPENRIFFPTEGTLSGVWETRDMIIEYQLSRKAEGIQLTGTLEWANHIIYNYTRIQLSLRANFFDANNTITGGQAIALSGPYPLKNSMLINALLRASEDNKGLAFSYSGRATDRASMMEGNGDSIVFTIWHTP